MEQMDCQEYLRRFSEDFDGLANDEASQATEEHRSACASCRRYAEILEAGAAALRNLPALEVPSDFRARLDHRIFHIEDGPSIAKESLGTGATTVSILALATLLALSAWAPVVATTHPMSELPALIVVRPAEPAPSPGTAKTTFHRSRSLFVTTEFREGIWGDSHELFRVYSSLSDRRRSGTAVQIGSQ